MSANLLNCAADLLQLRGHSNDGAGHDGSNICALQAIALADGRSRNEWGVGFSSEAKTAVRTLAEVIALPPPEWVDLSSMNDEMAGIATVYLYNDSGITQRQILAKMRLAAKILAERERVTAKQAAKIEADAVISKASKAAESIRYHMEAVCI